MSQERCPRCQAEVADVAAFCPRCGTPVQRLSRAAPTAQPEDLLPGAPCEPPRDIQPSDVGSNVALVLFISLLLLIIGWVYYAMYNRASPERHDSHVPAHDSTTYRH